MASGALQRFQLEIGERNRMHVIVSVVAFLLAVGLLGHAVLQSDGIDTQSTEAFETRSVVNAKGGYELEAPARWRVKKRGRATTMFSSRGDIFVTVGPA
ncbi:MAG: hypothetical protein ACRDJL_04390, partial [Actinomycetota bacterium]